MEPGAPIFRRVPDIIDDDTAAQLDAVMTIVEVLDEIKTSGAVGVMVLIDLGDGGVAVRHSKTLDVMRVLGGVEMMKHELLREMGSE